MALTAAASGAAVRRLASSRGLPKALSFLIRRCGDSPRPDEAPSKKETKDFLGAVADFLQRAHSSLPEEEFGNILKELLTSMSSLVLNKGVLYPTELANLVATFVPVGGTYVPHNSKVVVVDLVRRMDKCDRSNKVRNGIVFGGVGTFAGIAWYWPAAANKLEMENKYQADCIASAQSKVEALETKFAPLEAKVALLEYKIDAQKNEILALKDAALEKPKNCATLAEEVLSKNCATSGVEGVTLSTVYAFAAGVGITATFVLLSVWARK